MAETETTETQPDVFVKGRSQRTALLLLTAASQLEQPKQVVRAQLGGYKVPADVAERYEALSEELAADEAKGKAKTESAKTDTESKPAAKKTAAKKTTAKKTAAKTTQAKE